MYSAVRANRTKYLGISIPFAATRGLSNADGGWPP
jgi:hypothetical protein